MKLEKKRIVVTGGCSGMGAAAVKVFMKEGASVVCIDVNEPKDEYKVEVLLILDHKHPSTLVRIVHIMQHQKQQ